MYEISLSVTSVSVCHLFEFPGQMYTDNMVTDNSIPVLKNKQ